MQIKRLDIIEKVEIGKMTVAQTIIGNPFRQMMDMMIGNISSKPVKNRRKLQEG
jgi:hypothetical protein